MKSVYLCDWVETWIQRERRLAQAEVAASIPPPALPAGPDESVVDAVQPRIDVPVIHRALEKVQC